MTNHADAQFHAIEARDSAERARDAFVAGDYTNGLRDLATVEMRVRSAQAAAVKAWRESGATWQQVADVLGTTKQNVQQRFGV